MISGLFAIVFLSAAIKGTMELRNHIGNKESKLPRSEKQIPKKHYSFWNSYQRKI